METEVRKMLLKDQLFNKENVTWLAKLIKGVYPALDSGEFVKDVLVKFPVLELKERFFWIREMIEKHLPADYETTLKILLKSLDNSSVKSDFIFAAYSNYVAINGCSLKYLDISLNALGYFTEYCSAEFAIRSFINKFPDQTFLKFNEWSKSKNDDQRRLASEGLRPKLPWAVGINFDYKLGASVLDLLYYDKNRYVTRSVANHLNDISKIDAAFVVEKLRKWKKFGQQSEKEMDYIIRHSLRTLIKRGDVAALKFLGFDFNAKVTVVGLGVVNSTVSLGQKLEFYFDVVAEAACKLVIDYVVEYPSKTSRKSLKVFKIKTVSVTKGEVLHIEKKHLFRLMTTKKLYSGEHTLKVQINGKVMSAVKFELEV
ncbi:DNA alkylation repair protein [archaeon]|jgi:3-methyladenine DNA glycosylase AlkC|nr:DNA alkylation repair protein [archaeon]MBT6761881.1 DNA alkylation repair protein [archaeon]